MPPSPPPPAAASRASSRRKSSVGPAAASAYRKGVLAPLRSMRRTLSSGSGRIAVARQQHDALQLKTFQRWWQFHLPAGTIGDLNRDIRSGVPLVELLEALEGAKVPFRWTRAPKNMFERIDNLEGALEFLGGKGIKLLNISAASLSGATLESASTSEASLPKQVLSLTWAIVQWYELGGSGAGRLTNLHFASLLEWVRDVVNDAMSKGGKRVRRRARAGPAGTPCAEEAYGRRWRGARRFHALTPPPHPHLHSHPPTHTTPPPPPPPPPGSR